MQYTLKRAIFGLGKLHVQYKCPGCDEALLSPIGDAGETDTCPSCGQSYQVPGIADRVRLEKAADEKKQARQQAIERRQHRDRERNIQRQERELKQQARREATSACGQQAELTLGEGSVWDVVGESQYQDSLDRICGGKTHDGHHKQVTAVLVPEDDNERDKKAVRVDIHGLTVGYLSRDNARLFRKEPEEAGHAGRVSQCQAEIRGGWDRGGDDVGFFGVVLHIPFSTRASSRKERPQSMTNEELRRAIEKAAKAEVTCSHEKFGSNWDATAFAHRNGAIIAEGKSNGHQKKGESTYAALLDLCEKLGITADQIHATTQAEKKGK